MSRTSIFEFMKNGFPIAGNFDLACAVLEKEFRTILDIGVGTGAASLFFAQAGKDVTGIGLDLNSYGLPFELLEKLKIKLHEVTFESFGSDKKFDAIWASHVLEHTQNPGFFLDKAKSLLEDKGYLFVAVPPYKEQIVGGHVTNGWNMGQLLYNLLLAGFDVKHGNFICHGYNIFAVVQPLASKEFENVSKLIRMDNGDLEALSDFWPTTVSQNLLVKDQRISWVWPNWMQKYLQAPSWKDFEEAVERLKESELIKIQISDELEKIKRKHKLTTEKLQEEITHLRNICDIKSKSTEQLRRQLKAKN